MDVQWSILAEDIWGTLHGQCWCVVGEIAKAVSQSQNMHCDCCNSVVGVADQLTCRLTEDGPGDQQAENLAVEEKLTPDKINNIFQVPPLLVFYRKRQTST